ncbi:hypothetical protein FUT88_13430 [Ralstonia sp. TCR112]|uniref:GIY-YIG nuclease family protein n=1 Tax=Ralstonia sp. TCR112 TaxID=2601730 RepID=UPI0011BF5E08|nr:GIY-YIG nuclease family protein [Ralstonia sp. TCR112]TXD58873.1 hypothetical protein FUT88_13430 [Ralstonia sp. TCR112]
MAVGIYVIRNVSNGKVYIGSSGDVTTRWRQHRSDLNCGRHHSISLQRAWAKYGCGAFQFELIEIVQDVDQLLVREQFWIDSYRSTVRECGYNIAKHAEAPMRGRKHRPESIAKQIAAQTGRRFKKSEEARLRERELRQSNPLPPMSEQTRQRLSDALTGRKLSDETRMRMSIAKRKPRGPQLSRRALTPEQSAQVKARLRSGDLGYVLAAEFGVSATTISNIRKEMHGDQHEPIQRAA